MNDSPTANQSAREIRCHANRGREYSVAFNAAGEPQSVRVKCYNPDNSTYFRMLWNISYERMTTTVACAIRSAQAKLEAA